MCCPYIAHYNYLFPHFLLPPLWLHVVNYMYLILSCLTLQASNTLHMLIAGIFPRLCRLCVGFVRWYPPPRQADFRGFPVGSCRLKALMMSTSRWVRSEVWLSDLASRETPSQQQSTWLSVQLQRWWSNTVILALYWSDDNIFVACLFNFH